MNEIDHPSAPSLLARANRLLLRVAKWGGLGLLLFVGVVFLITHGNDLYDSFTQPPPGHGIVLPDTALPEDDAFATVHRFAESADKVFEKIQKDRKSQDKHCGGLATQKPVDWSCVDTVVRETADPLKAFDAWLAGPARYTLARPPDLERHIRIQGIDFKNWIAAPIQNFLVFQSLSRALAYRSLTKRRAGDVAGAERDLRTIFALGAFLQQNPILISHMVGLLVHNAGLGALVTHLPAEAAAPDLDGLLPAPHPYVESFKMAIGTEWLGLREYIRYGLAQRWGTSDSGVGGVIGSVPLQVTGVLGFYSEAHTLRLLAGDSQAALRHLETGIMAGSPSKDYWREACPLSEWTWPVIFVRPNLVGRIYACIIGFSWDIYLGRTGQAMDRLAATNIVFAARQFKQKQGRWPTQESDLVPAYLKAWPTSALGGQPLRWLDDKSGILILGDDGKKLCEPSQWCRLPFDPPAPVAQASKRVR